MNIRQDNLQALATQVFKAKLNISLEILKLLYFNVRNYYVRGQSTLARRIWGLILSSFKNEKSQERF